MSIFCRDKLRSVHGFILKFLNNNCPDLKALYEGPRADRRVNLTVVVGVVPLEKKKPQVEKAFTAVTKEFSGVGVGLVVQVPWKFEQAILCFRFEEEMYYARATVRHLTFLGGGFYQLGFEMNEMVNASAYPELPELSEQLFECE
ncbi:MAG: hypothetical protein JXB10_15005 [Pirellulales bacterium]|nr:hypothetical protein [Pirellulales bacterium]